MTGLTDEQRLAELIHSKICQRNHYDKEQCSWYFDTFEDDSYDIKLYLHKAKNILKVSTFEQAFNVLDLLPTINQR